MDSSTANATAVSAASTIDSSSPIDPQSDSSVSIWDALQGDSYLISLLPISDLFRYFPDDGQQGKKYFTAGMVAAALMVSFQAGAHPKSLQRSAVTSAIANQIPTTPAWRHLQLPDSLSAERRRSQAWNYLYYAFVILVLPRLHQRWKEARAATAPTENEATVTTELTRLSRQRRQFLYRLVDTVIPLVQWTVLMRLWRGPSTPSIPRSVTVQPPVANTTTALAPLFAMFAYRRLVHTEAMRLVSILSNAIKWWRGGGRAET